MAVDMFIKFEPAVEGESADSKHKKEIDVLAWSWSMSQNGTMHLGSGGGAGKVNVNDLSFTKYVDKSTPALLMAVCQGKHFDKVHLVVRKAGGPDALEYIKIELINVMVTGVSSGGSGGEERLTENVSLNFAEFKYVYQPQNDKGAKEGGEVKANFNIRKNKAD